MKVNYVLMYGTPYLKYREFETFEDISKFLVNKGIVNYSIFKKLEDEEEVEMIYRDNDIRFLENIIKEVRECAKRELKIAEENIKNSEQWLDVEEEQEHAKRDIHTGKIVKRYMEMFLEILDKVGDNYNVRERGAKNVE